MSLPGKLALAIFGTLFVWGIVSELLRRRKERKAREADADRE